MADPRLSEVGLRRIEEQVNLNMEAWALLDLINAEFQTDPMSVQCFDLRIVKRVKEAVEKMEKINPLYRSKP